MVGGMTENRQWQASQAPAISHVHSISLRNLPRLFEDFIPQVWLKPFERPAQFAEGRSAGSTVLHFSQFTAVHNSM